MVAGFSSGKLYHETAFTHLLRSESHRSQRTGLAHHLLLLSQHGPQGEVTAMPAPVVASVVRVLSHCLRETDYIGWYRDGHVIGGVLTAMGKEIGVDQIQSFSGRVQERLRRELGEKESGGVQVRICSYQELAKGDQEVLSNEC